MFLSICENSPYCFLDISIIKVLFSEMRRPGDHVCCCCEESPDQTDDDNTLWLLNTPDLTLGLLSSSVVWILTPQIGIKIMGEKLQTSRKNLVIFKLVVLTKVLRPTAGCNCFTSLCLSELWTWLWFDTSALTVYYWLTDWLTVLVSIVEDQS